MTSESRRKESDSPGLNAGVRRGEARRRGLGIDAGGTYTDAVIYDFRDRSVLAKGKALTTRWDFTIGIAGAIDRLPAELLEEVELVSVSTTLATNAIVEGQGQKVGLLLMSADEPDPEQIQADSTRVIRGRMTISGVEKESVDHDEVRRAARELRDRDGVQVFAVSGYGASINPSHELEVKKILLEETDLGVCCGHELSDLLNFYVRANTAVLNARIIPLLEKFIADAEKTLSIRHIDAPVMVVRGDGTLMSASLAKVRPIETILSGPAASIAGARFLTGITEATVVDVGGTTSDIGCIRGGRVDISRKGAKVGGWRTHVQALDLSTLGLGGDSAVLFEEEELKIGPRRIAPMCWLGSGHDLTQALCYVEQNRGYFTSSMKSLQFLSLTGEHPEVSMSAGERAITDILKDGPCSVLELAEKCGSSGRLMTMRTADLENRFILQRCGLTPTDILHVSGALKLWDTGAAERILALYAERMKVDAEVFCDRVLNRMTDRLIEELIKKQLNLETGLDESDDCPSCRILLDAMLRQDDEYFKVDVSFFKPIIGLGAPVSYFLTPAAGKIGAEIVIPEHADVANAVGAITSMVHVVKKAVITPSSEGDFLVHGLKESARFENIEDAAEYAETALREEIILLARAAGTGSTEVSLRFEETAGRSSDGGEVMIERSIEAEITGAPDLAGRQRE
jgi:N-methylhydantoinase A/oxoprolinase/acetone carboxylase beta subunit